MSSQETTFKLLTVTVNVVCFKYSVSIFLAKKHHANYFPLADKTKELITPTPKPVPPVVHSSMVPSHHPVPGLISGHSLYMEPNAIGPGVSASMIVQRTSEEERWVARQRKLRQEKEDRQYQVSEFRQQVLEQHLDLGRPGDTTDHRTDLHRSVGCDGFKCFNFFFFITKIQFLS